MLRHLIVAIALGCMLSATGCCKQGGGTSETTEEDKSVFTKLSTFKAPPCPSDIGEAYENRKKSGTPVPPTAQDAFLADVLIILKQDFSMPDVSATTLTEADIGKVVQFYVATVWTKIRGYRPWFHKNFIDSLTAEQRTTFTKEAYAHVKANGINDPG
jgi:hypothetical protein